MSSACKPDLEGKFGKKINLKIEEIKVPETDAQLDRAKALPSRSPVACPIAGR